jgi:hypothetical protein
VPGARVCNVRACCMKVARERDAWSVMRDSNVCVYGLVRAYISAKGCVVRVRAW